MDRHFSLTQRARAVGLAVLTAGIVSSAAQAQTFQFSSFEIEGNQRIEDATILSFIDLPTGQSVSAARVNDGLQRLQNSGLFESVELVPQGNRLIVVVQEFPTINQINFEGNDRLDAEILQSLVTSQVRRVFSPQQAERDAATIIQAYADQGRLTASVTPKIIRRSDNRVDLVFEISEGRTVEIERVSFVGNRAYSDRRLRRVLESTQAGIFRALIRSDTFVADRIAFDRQLLRDFYQARGYVDAQVLSVSSELSPERDGFFLTFRVQEGQQFRFGALTASSDLSDVDPDQFQDEIRIGEGKTYSPQAVDATIERLELLALQQGLDFVRVTPRVTRNDEARTLDIDFVVERGPRVFVERIDIEGNATTLDRVIRRQFATVEGDPFNPRAIRAAAERIRALGYFTQSDVSAREGSDPSQVIVDVDVEEQPTGSLGFGANYSVQDGVGLALTFRETNFLGRGQVVNFTLDTSSDNANSQLTFAEPFFLTRDLAASFSVFYRTTDSEDGAFDTRSVGASVGLGFPTGEYSDLRMSYSFTRDTLTPDSVATISQIIEDEQGTADTSAIGYRWRYDTRNVGLNPDAGVLLQFGQEFAGLGGDEEFIKSTFRLAGETTVWNGDVLLLATVEGGNLTSLGDTVSRESNRFFNSQNILRGFESSGIGPRDLNAGNDPLGGNNYFAARVEAQFPINLVPEEYGISGAVFYDMGSVWGLDNVNGGTGGLDIVDDSFELRSTIGFGLLWDTQIGPLRFNFTNAINAETADREQSFDFTISTRF
ncbi:MULTISPECIES: outer membrane protein assembly factor BamA [Thalassobacter]|uniref:outer membrane protein assembly factor BamA n=1 Tax=Thalassobacter TaxID=266808 RepID=UPI00051E0328|nr:MULTISPECIES: outer membrane protein assembly factor BamA [Thalassobacter]KGL02805.1 outer membrane protein assembly complex, YaeT protein [Thalassobacter sp. 16PALIMAR09]